jgi:hypothetical protein
MAVTIKSIVRITVFIIQAKLPLFPISDRLDAYRKLRVTAPTGRTIVK